MKYFKSILFILAIGMVQQAMAQSTFVGMYSESFTVFPPSGPKFTTIPANFVTNSTQSVPAGGSFSVSAAFSNQQYTGTGGSLVAGQNDQGMMFGVSNNNSAKTLVRTSTVVTVGDIGQPQNNYFSATPATIGSGLDVGNNYSFNCFSSCEGLAQANSPTMGRYYFGDITFTFSKPVDYPILHVSGLGGFLSVIDASSNTYTLPFATELKITTPGLSLSRLSGTNHTALSVDTIKNTFDESEYILNGNIPLNGDYTGTGSFQVNGTNITTVTFKVIMHGMSASQIWSSNSTFSNQVYNGDRYDLSWTLPTYTFSGVVVIDNLSATAPVAGTAYTGGGLNAVLVDGTGKVMQVVPVSTVNGTFNFTEVIGDGYTVQLQNTANTPTVGTVAPTTATLPSGYYTKAEAFGTSNTPDATPNSITTSYPINYSTTAPVTTAPTLILGISTNPLVVTGVQLSGILTGSTVNLNWKSITEINSKSYIVERSTDGTSFSAIGTVAAAGNSNQPINYNYADNNLGASNILYYRLKMEDMDGTWKYSNVIKISLSASSQIKVFPTVFTSNTAVEFSNNKGQFDVAIVNQLGQVMQSQRVVVTGDVQYVNINKSGNMAAGIYYVNIKNTSNGESFTQKVLIH